MQKITNKINQSQIVKKVFFLFVLILATGLVAYSQPPTPGGEPNTPIDGGLSLLVAAGVGYGAKKMKERRKK